MRRPRASWRSTCTGSPAISQKPPKGKWRSRRATSSRSSATPCWSSRREGRSRKRSEEGGRTKVRPYVPPADVCLADRDSPAAVDVLQSHVDRRPHRRFRKALRPLDRHHRRRRHEVFQCEIRDLAWREAIEIHVLQRHLRPAILLNDGEGGAADLGGVDAEALGKSSDERGLAGAEVAVEQDRRAGRQLRDEPAARGDGVGLRWSDELQVRWRSLQVVLRTSPFVVRHSFLLVTQNG